MDGRDARGAYGSTDGQGNSKSEKEHGIPAPVTKMPPKKRGKVWGSATAMERGASWSSIAPAEVS